MQQALLKLVEGTQVKLSFRGRKEQEAVTLDTRNILFIAGGAFASLEVVLEKRFSGAGKGLGFHHDAAGGGAAIDRTQLFGTTHPDDLCHFGLIPEFVGQFPVICALHGLDEDALVKQYRHLFAFEDVNLEFTDAALRAVAREALAMGMEARGLRSVLERILRKPMFELPSVEGVEKCIVDVACITDAVEPELVFRARAADMSVIGGH